MLFKSHLCDHKKLMMSSKFFVTKTTLWLHVLFIRKTIQQSFFYKKYFYKNNEMQFVEKNEESFKNIQGSRIKNDKTQI